MMYSTICGSGHDIMVCWSTGSWANVFATCRILIRIKNDNITNDISMAFLPFNFSNVLKS